MQPWIGGLLAAMLASLPVWFWDDLENLGEGGPTNLILPVALFVLAWAWTVPILRRASRPRAEGILAGALVAALMAVLLWRILASLDGTGNWPLLVVFGIPFYALAIGLGGAAGAIAQSLAGREAGREPGSRAVGTACILAGLALLLVCVLFFPPLIAAMYYVPLLLAGGLVAVGLWQVNLARVRDRQAP